MALDEQAVLSALRGVRFPGFSRDLVSLGIVRRASVQGDRVELELDLRAAEPAAAATVRREAESVVGALPGVTRVVLRGVETGAAALPLVGAKRPPADAAPGVRGLLPHVRHVVAVASGKGGVGKSTVAVNLAVALARSGAATGLLDADVYGPSIPLMMGLARERPTFDAERRRLIPFDRFGVRFMSLGFLVDPDTAVIWRGPMVMKAIEQLLGDVEWGALDVLVVDLPPGTGDAQLTLSQRVRLSGAVIVTTPQDVALADAIKGIAMFRRVEVPVLGLVENMSFFCCPHCGGRSEIFGHGGGRAEAERLGVPFLGEVPLAPAIRASGDAGAPIAATDPAGDGMRFAELAARVLRALDSVPGAPQTAARR